MIRSYCVALILALTWPAHAQTTTDWLGQHADESSITLYSHYEIYIYPNRSYLVTHRYAYRIQNEKAMDKGEISLWYNAKRQKVRFFTATITTPDGKKLPYKKLQDIGESYHDNRQKILTMPRVLPGSTIEVESKIFNAYGPVSGEFSALFPLYAAYPIQKKIITVSAPSSVPLALHTANNAPAPTIEVKGKRTYWQWRFDNGALYRPSLVKEGSLPPDITFLPYASFSTLTDWQTLARWYWKQFKPSVTVTPRIRKIARSLTKNASTDIDKARILTTYIQNTFRYVEMQLDEHHYMPHPADEVLRNAYGDCKDYAAALIALLKSVGISAWPVLNRAYESGSVQNTLPDMGHFSHLMVAAVINRATYFIDPQLKGYQPGDIPAALEGDYVLIVTDTGGIFSRMPFCPLDQKSTMRKERIHIKKNGSALIRQKIRFTRLQSIRIRHFFKFASILETQLYFENLDNNTRGGKIISFTKHGQDKEYECMSFTIVAKKKRYTPLLGPYMVFGSTEMNMLEGFSNKTRNYPLWFSQESKRITRIEYILPDEYQPAHIPSPVTLRSPVIDIAIRYTRNKKSITGTAVFHYKRAYIAAKKYSRFRAFLARAEDALNQSIIIKKTQSRK